MLRRGTDFFARYGGEEFVALILGGSAESDFDPLEGRPPGGGESAHSPQPGGFPVGDRQHRRHYRLPKLGTSYDMYLKMADAMLYDAKRFGRNQVVWTNERMEQQREK